MAHFAPIPDPLAKYRGMSWLTPVIREVMADSGFRDHKIQFLEKGGSVNFLFQIAKESMTEESFMSFVKKYRERYDSPGGAHQSIFLRAAVDATPLGSNFQEMDLKQISGHGETRICMAAGVPPIVVGASEGLAAATYSNYGQARRKFVDETMRFLWQNAAGSLEVLVPAPSSRGGSQLWYDDRDIPALQDDIEARAKVQQMQATSMSTLAKEGWDPDSIVEAISSGDWTRLRGQHSGLLSVQLQPPASKNGSGKPENVPAPNATE